MWISSPLVNTWVLVFLLTKALCSRKSLVERPGILVFWGCYSILRRNPTHQTSSHSYFIMEWRPRYPLQILCHIFSGGASPSPTSITFALRTFQDCNAIISRIHRIHFKTEGHFIASRRTVEDAAFREEQAPPLPYLFVNFAFREEQAILPFPFG